MGFEILTKITGVGDPLQGMALCDVMVRYTGLERDG
jgi:hypothetical protein